jgi:hypothetical protein
LVHGVEAIVIASFLGLLTIRELLRADDGERSNDLMRRLWKWTLLAGVGFAVVIGTRFYGLAT